MFIQDTFIFWFFFNFMEYINVYESHILWVLILEKIMYIVWLFI